MARKQIHLSTELPTVKYTSRLKTFGEQPKEVTEKHAEHQRHLLE